MYNLASGKLKPLQNMKLLLVFYVYIYFYLTDTMV